MKRSKHGLFVFPPKKTLIRRRHFSIGQSSCGMSSKRSIDRFLENSPERSLNHPKATRVCIRSINQSNRFTSVRLWFLFCSRVFISRSRKSLYQLTDPNLGSTHTAPDKFPTGWKTWPDTSFTRSRSVYSRCSKHLNARNFQPILAVWTSPKFSWVVNSRSEYRVTFTDAGTLKKLLCFLICAVPKTRTPRKAVLQST